MKKNKKLRVTSYTQLASGHDVTLKKRDDSNTSNRTRTDGHDYFWGFRSTEKSCTREARWRGRMQVDFRSCFPTPFGVRFRRIFKNDFVDKKKNDCPHLFRTFFLTTRHLLDSRMALSYPFGGVVRPRTVAVNATPLGSLHAEPNTRRTSALNR